MESIVNKAPIEWSVATFGLLNSDVHLVWIPTSIYIVVDLPISAEQANRTCNCCILMDDETAIRYNVFEFVSIDNVVVHQSKDGRWDTDQVNKGLVDLTNNDTLE